MDIVLTFQISTQDHLQSSCNHKKNATKSLLQRQGKNNTCSCRDFFYNFSAVYKNDSTSTIFQCWLEQTCNF